MVSVKENAIRFEGAISYQWAVDAHAAVVGTVERWRSAIVARATATRRAVVSAHARGSRAARAYPSSVRDRAAAGLLGMSPAELDRLRQFALNPIEAKVKPPAKARAKTVESVQLSKPATGMMVNAKTLSEAVGRVRVAVSKHRSIPILDHILLEADKSGGRLYMSATDLEIGVRTNIEVAVSDFAPIAVPAKALADALKGSTGTVSIANHGESDVKLTVDGVEHILKGLPAEEFPMLPDVISRERVQFPGLAGILKKLSCASGVDELKSILMSVLIDSKHVCSTDTRRAHLVEHDMDLDAVLPEGSVTMDGKRGIIIPSSCCEKLMRLLGCSAEDIIEIGCSNTQVEFRFLDSVVTSRLIDGTFPNYEKIIPNVDNCHERFTVNTKSFLALLKRLSPMATDNGDRLVFTYGIGKVELSGSSRESGDVCADLECITSGEDGFQTAFDCDYMTDAVELFGHCSEVVVSGHSPVSQFAVTSPQEPGTMAIVMPCTVG